MPDNNNLADTSSIQGLERFQISSSSSMMVLVFGFVWLAHEIK
jgi:hypothetical protein